MHRFRLFAACVFLLGGCGQSDPGDADGGPTVDDPRAEGPRLAGEEDERDEIVIDPDAIRDWPILKRIRLDIPTPNYPAPDSMIRNVISLEEVDPDVIYSAEHCREPKGLQVSFSWQGVHGGAIATVFGTQPRLTTNLRLNRFAVVRYELCVSTDTDPNTKCTGGLEDEIYQIAPPRNHLTPPDGLPRDKFYLKDFTWQVRACRNSPAVCGAWSEAVPLAWGFATPIELRQETFTLGDESLGLKLHYCNVDKTEAAASGTDHIICLWKADTPVANAAATCQAQYDTGMTQGTEVWFRLSSNSPEDIFSSTDLPAQNADNVWAVGACNSNVATKFCAWSTVQPRTFPWPF